MSLNFELRNSSVKKKLSQLTMQESKPLGQACDICGDIGFAAAIVTCSRCCKSREHIYCMQPNLSQLPESWYCEACLCPKLDKAETHNFPKAPAMRVRHVSFKIPDASGPPSRKPAARILSRNFVPKKVDTGKVKFIPLEAIHTLPSKTRPNKPPSQGSPRSQLPYFGMKCRPSARKTSVASRENQHAFKSSGNGKPSVVGDMQTGSPEKQNVKLSQPLNPIKSPSNFPCRSSISGSSRSAAVLTVRDKKHISGEIYHSPLDGVQQKCKSKNVSPGLAKHKDKLSFLLSKDYVSKEEPVDAIAPYDQDGTSSSKTLFKIVEEVLPNPPAVRDAWKGSFEISDFVHEPYEGIRAYPPERVSRKAYLVSKQMPVILQFTLLPRCTVWPQIFHIDSPSGFDIGLYFQFDTFSRSRESYNILLQHIEEQDLSLQSLLDGVRLLLFSSKLLPAKSQRINKQYYLWGVFTPFKHPAPVASKVSHQLVDMEIDNLGGKEIGTRDVLLRRPSITACRDGSDMLSQNRHVPHPVNAPPGFSKLAKLQERASPSQLTPHGGRGGSTKKIKSELDSVY